MIELQSSSKRRTARHGLVYYFRTPPEDVITPEEFRRSVVKINGREWYVTGIVCDWVMKEGVRYRGPFGLAVVEPSKAEERYRVKEEDA